MERKNIQKLLILLGIAVFSLVAVSLISISVAINAINASKEPIKNADIAAIEIKDSEPIYFVREHEGVIGVFSEDSVLLETINIAVVTLPKKDQDALSFGITVKGTKNLEILKQDFSG